MIAETGHFCLILALICAAAQTVPLLAVRAARLQLALSGAALACLVLAYIVTDLSVANVVQNSHSMKPLLYKIAGSWGNHEDSMLLWVFMLALFGGFISLSRDPRHDPWRDAALTVQGGVCAGFLFYTLFASNPFARVMFPPADGNDLNPVLQDPALAFHPPLLYLGYVGFSAVFSYALAALVVRPAASVTEPGRLWAARVKPFALAAWTALSAGIALGSFWAYYELGWGGFWFWDPVENASLMPWLTGTALIHSILVLEKRNALPRWTVLLAILTFSLSILGTFLVRSGVLTSVHAFAVDPLRGVFVLALLSLYTGGGLLLYALRAGRFTGRAAEQAETAESARLPAPLHPVSREGAILLNNLFLTAAAATVLTGTLYPLVLNALNAGQVSVGAPYFNMTVIPLAALMMLLMAVSPFLPWKRGAARKLLPFAKIMAAAAGSAAALAYGIGANSHLGKTALLSPLTVFLAAWLMAGAGMQLWHRLAGEAPWPARLRALPMGQWGLSLAHFGLGLAVLGMAGTGLWAREASAIVNPGSKVTLGAYVFTVTDIAPAFGPNYTAARATLTVREAGGARVIATLSPARRHYPVADKVTTEAGIATRPFTDFYAALGDNTPEGWILRLWIHPLIACLWTGFAFIIAGGLVSLIGACREKKN